MTRIDLDWGCLSVLVLPDGHKHWVAGFDRMARLAQMSGVGFVWDPWETTVAGWCDRQKRLAHLAPWTYECGPVCFKHVFSHELGHGLHPHAPEWYILQWQRARFGDTIDLDYLRIA